MNIKDIDTPAIILDLDTVERNLRRYSDMAKENRKRLWPMIKTHKSTYLAALQKKYGADGFLCGTLDEAEALCQKGFDNIMYAYPVAGKASIDRVVRLSKKCRFFVRIDGIVGAEMLGEAALRERTVIDYTVIIDCGLHRFGVDPGDSVDLVKKLSRQNGLRYRGISTHPGHVYVASDGSKLHEYCSSERETMARAKTLLTEAGFPPELVTSGSTPTFFGSISDECINIYHPGNYIFNDAIQMSLGTATEEDCALRILTCIISHPSEKLFICDAGAKCLGLDTGAHGNDSIKGYGIVKGHPELTVISLSEEVGKLTFEGETTLKVGDIIEIIPNHSCSSANLTSWYRGLRGGKIEQMIETDIRGNSQK
ncbi:MAG: amino-acid racemase [Clostridiales bacterium]|nr:amino-acid racemase [Clostridiales bacterium]